ncbi:MAG: (2Fe-2S)-binding protein [Hyphomicrobiaceae bacterium]
MADNRTITLQVNGKRRSGTTETRTHLGDFLRDELGLTGTHLGCEHGACGACTVLVDDEALRSCLMLAVQAQGTSITTIEGLSDGAELSAVQQAFREHHGLQCGFCTPGMVISLTAFLKKEPNPTERSIREAISGNICRCTGYQAIVKAGLKAASVLREEP